MKATKEDLIKYRLLRSKDTFEDAQILADRQKWNSTINRLYYSAYYAVMALLLFSDLKPATHNGAKSNFTEHFIKTERIPKEFGKIYSQLFTQRIVEVSVFSSKVSISILSLRSKTVVFLTPSISYSNLNFPVLKSAQLRSTL